MNLRTVFSLLLCMLVLASPVLAQDPSDARVRNAIAVLERLAQSEIDQRGVVGIGIGVVHKDRLIYAKGFGERVVGSGQKVDADTVFQLASVSKPVGATVVAALIGDGKINWESKINELDPTFEMNQPWVTSQVTLRDMYAHRSGLPDHAGDLLEDMGYNRAEVLHRLRYQMPDSSFRSHYAYTNFGLTAAAEAAAKANGMTWEDASAEKLYKPLGMQSSSSRFSDFMSRQNKALPHVLVDGKWVQKYERQPDAQSPAGGVSSSVNDMAKWMRLRMANGKFEGKQVVAEAPLMETQHPVMLTQFNPINGLPGFYGLGMNVGYDEHGRLHLSHSGAFALGVGSNISMVPSEQVGVIVLTNSYPRGIAEGLATTFIELATDGKQSQDWLAMFKKVFANPATLGLDKSFDYSKMPAQKSPALANAAYVGTYTNDLYGDIQFVEKNGAMEVVMGPKRISLPMAHYDRDTFTYTPIGENSAGRSGITFQIGPDGKASSVTIENLNEDGQGSFARRAG